MEHGAFMNFHSFSIQGIDARDFLNRVTTVNVKKLQLGWGTKGLLLTGTAKVIAPFFLFCLSQERFLVLVCDSNAEDLFEGLENLHFSEKFEITKISKNSGLTKTIVPDGEKFLPEEHSLEREFFSFSMGTDETNEEIFFPFPLKGVYGFFSDKSYSPVEESEFTHLRISSMYPIYEKEWTKESNALDVGFLPWIHRGKGCYPGQEVVERSLNVGHPSKSLVLITADVPLKEKDDLLVEGKKIGILTSTFAAEGLAIVQWKYKNSGTSYQVMREGLQVGVAKCQK